jgi:hypothetical protein
LLLSVGKWVAIQYWIGVDCHKLCCGNFGYPKVNSAFIVIYGALAGYLLSFGDEIPPLSMGVDLVSLTAYK